MNEDEWNAQTKCKTQNVELYNKTAQLYLTFFIYFNVQGVSQRQVSKLHNIMNLNRTVFTVLLTKNLRQKNMKCWHTKRKNIQNSSFILK